MDRSEAYGSLFDMKPVLTSARELYTDKYYENISSNYIQSFEDSKIHPVILKALEELDSGNAKGVRYDYLDQFRDYPTRLRIMSGYRRPEDQIKLIEAGVSRAEPYKSFHNWGLAVDIIPRETGYGKKTVYGSLGNDRDLKYLNFLEPASWVSMGLPQWWKSHSNKYYSFEWGGDWLDFTDVAHFQVKTKIPIENQLADELGSFLGRKWWDLEGLALKSMNTKQGALNIGLIMVVIGGVAYGLNRR